jgi:uncharacterized alkaline shock family protein YloU
MGNYFMDRRVHYFSTPFLSHRTRLANVSRQKLASVQVTLDISYQEISKLPKLVQQIKTNIVEELSTYESR